MNAARVWRPCWLAAVTVALSAVGLAGQNTKKVEELQPENARQEKPWGRTVYEVIIIPASVNREQVLKYIKTKKGRKLTRSEVQEDLTRLYDVLKHRTHAFWSPVGEDRATVTFRITATKNYDRSEFKGNIHLSETEARTLAGLSKTQRLSEEDADRVRLVLQDHYRGEGYRFVNVDVALDDVERTVRFFIDEGPQVRVSKLRFRGNKSFPGTIWLGYGENLRGSPKLDNVHGLFTGDPFSKWKVEDDTLKVELFYRRNGYLNAKVHLEETLFSRDHETVELTYRVEEGQRFKVTGVDLELQRSDQPGDARASRASRYSKDEVMKVIKLKVGDYFSTVQINQDKFALEAFYGTRGHPTARRYGRRLDNLFRVLEPWINPLPNKPEVKITYRLVEGEPKRLREVRIHGNVTTKDPVIRRRVKLLPGDTLDVTKLDRSEHLLNRTRYFVDPKTLSGVRFLLTPVDQSEAEVDLDIFVQEGETGTFTWGAAVSTGTGVRGNFQFIKRNFDITRLPSSWNPGTWFSEIADGKAFHGGDQNLDLLISPGTELSTFRLSWFEPDLLGQHMDTIGVRVDGFKTIRILDTYDTDRLGTSITLSRIFDETTSVNMTIKDETVKVKNIDPNAPLIVFDNEGQTEIRALRVGYRLSDLDSTLHPRKGYNFNSYAELAGGLLGASESFYKIGSSLEVYRPFYSDSLDRKHVLYTRVRVDFADTFGSTDDLFPSERLFMGGSNLRGFDQRRAGPTQFDEPLGGTAMLLSTLEYQFPLVSTQMQGTTRETEIIRGVMFMDFGLLGLDLNDDTFREPRLTIGFGVRIQVPVLQVPIQLDLAWPLLAEQTDREEQLLFSFRRF